MSNVVQFSKYQKQASVDQNDISTWFDDDPMSLTELTIEDNSDDAFMLANEVADGIADLYGNQDWKSFSATEQEQITMQLCALQEVILHMILYREGKPMNKTVANLIDTLAIHYFNKNESVLK